MSANDDSTHNDEVVSQFLAVTGSADVGRAQSYLEMSGGNLEMAVGLFMEHTAGGGGGGGGAAAADDGLAAAAGHDAAAAGASPHVRAPDETRRMRLMDHDDDDNGVGVGGMGMMMPGAAAGMPPGMLMNALMAEAGNDIAVGNQDDNDLLERASAFSRAAAVMDPRAAVNLAAAQAASAEAAAGADEDEMSDGAGRPFRAPPHAQPPHAQQDVLPHMFAPPTHLMHKGGFQTARSIAKDAKRWLLVNIQSDAEFSSHALNRDVWRDDLVENLIREGFIFFQTMNTTNEGRTFCQRYSVQDFPHVSIIDPRTGRLMWRKEGWTQEYPLTKQDFAELAMDFCSRHSLDKPPTAAAPARPAPPAASLSSTAAAAGGGGGGAHKRKVMSESEELQAALRASLNPNNQDDDSDDDDEVEYLGSSEDVLDNDDEQHSEEKAEPSLVNALLNHTVGDEPANGEAAARIQIRMPNAKVVRKFAPQDTVKSVYAFVAQSNDEAKSGKEFSLLAGFPPKDLIEDIDKTVESSGLSGQAISFRWKS